MIAIFPRQMGKCSFQVNWLKSPDYKDWLLPVPGDRFAARCSSCQKNFSVSHMGEYALKSHIKSKKHSKSTREHNRNQRINFGSSKSAIACASSSVHELAEKASEIQAAEILWATKCVQRLMYRSCEDVTAAYCRKQSYGAIQRLP